MSWKTLFPPNTIVGKLSRGDNAGALSSATNYVKSGEMTKDIANVGRIVATGGADVTAWYSMGKKAYGTEIQKALNPQQQTAPVGLTQNAGVNSLGVTTAQATNLLLAQKKRNQALAIGSGVPVQNVLGITTPISAGEALKYTGTAINSASFQAQADNSTLLMFAGLIGAYMFLK